MHWKCSGEMGDQQVSLMSSPLMHFGWRWLDAGRNHCFQDLALGAIRLLTLPISNAPVERPFSQETLFKDDTRNCMGLPLLSTSMNGRTGLSRNGWTSTTFRPPLQFLERFDSSMYYLVEPDCI